MFLLMVIADHKLPPCCFSFVFGFLQEGCCIITGLGYNGIDENGKAKWDGLRNIRLTKYYTGYSLEVNSLWLTAILNTRNNLYLVPFTIRPYYTMKLIMLCNSLISLFIETPVFR